MNDYLRRVNNCLNQMRKIKEEDAFADMFATKINISGAPPGGGAPPAAGFKKYLKYKAKYLQLKNQLN